MNYKKVLFKTCWPLSPIYSAIMRVRAYLYDCGIFTQHKFTVPIISVGNLTMGGTGKTPTVLFITKALQERGLKPVIVSRGYGGKAKGQVNIVSDPKEVKMNAYEAGDEPFMLASQLPGVPVITGSKRFLSIEHAIDHFEANLIILDDGFQHLSVKRDIDLVLFGAQSGFGNNRVFPGGDLRESRHALQRADFFLITGITNGNLEPQALIDDLGASQPQVPCYLVTRSEGSYFSATEQRECSKDDLPTKAFAFCGIANPERFRADLEGSGFAIKGFLPLSDHQHYHEQVLSEISKSCQDTQAQVLLTTEKDLVKLDGFTPPLPLFSVRPKTTISAKLIDILYQKAHEIIKEKSIK